MGIKCVTVIMHLKNLVSFVFSSFLPLFSSSVYQFILDIIGKLPKYLPSNVECSTVIHYEGEKRKINNKENQWQNTLTLTAYVCNVEIQFRYYHELVLSF